MTRDELLAYIQSENYQWADGEHEGKLGIFIRWKDDDSEKIFVDESALSQLSWPQIRGAVINGRDVYHVSRIVGYMSRIQNWNQSKIGELKDRHKGDYKIR